MKIKHYILSLLLALSIAPFSSFSQSNNQQISFNFYGDTIQFPFDRSLFVDFNGALSDVSINSFYQSISSKNYDQVMDALINYKSKYQPNDWMYYQLIRKTAQQISPKEKNYPRYTLYKWYFLCQSGYDATLRISGDKIPFLCTK